MILDKSMVIFIVTGNNNMRHTIIIYNCDYTGIIILKKKTKLHGLSPRANYTDRATDYYTNITLK
jgi:hypothetical protein